MISAPYHLSQGDLVAIIPPAKSIDIIYINKAKNILESWGLNVILSDNINDSYYQFAGNDQDRYEAFQKLLDNPEVKCIFCARGGYGTTRIIDKISFDTFKKNPKWKKIPLVFLTAKTDSLSATFGKIVSEDYILKPFEISDLKKSIDKFLD